MFRHWNKMLLFNKRVIEGPTALHSSKRAIHPSMHLRSRILTVDQESLFTSIQVDLFVQTQTLGNQVSDS